MKMLVAIDLSDSTSRILEKSVGLVKKFRGKIWLLHVAEPNPAFVGYEAGPQSVRDFQSRMYHAEHKQIQQFAKEMRYSGLEATSLLIQGAVADTILAEAERLGVDMIVVGSKGHGTMYQVVVGSVSGEVLRRASCPILVVPTHTEKC